MRVGGNVLWHTSDSLFAFPLLPFGFLVWGFLILGFLPGLLP